MISIYEAFDIAFNITAIIPCLALIIIYLILKKDLKYPHYFKLELMLILLVIISLDFASSNFSNNQNKENSKKIIVLIKSYLDIVLSFFLLSFSYLCYTLSKTKKNDSSKSLIIALSLVSWILPVYRIKFNGKEENNNIDFIINICVISSIYFLDLIFYILIIVNMCSIKKKDEENNKYYNRNIKRMTLNFMSHLSLCSVLLIDLIRRKYLYENKNTNGKDNENEQQKDYVDLLNSLAYNFISYISFLEGKTTDYLKSKFRSCFSFEKLSVNDDDDEEESESDDDEDDDDDDIQIYNENEESVVSYA